MLVGLKDVYMRQFFWHVKICLSGSDEAALQSESSAQCRVFALGDRVLALLPVTSSLFHAKFAGPYNVIRKVLDINYMIATPIILIKIIINNCEFIITTPALPSIPNKYIKIP